jgi:hypothetical protein
MAREYKLTDIQHQIQVVKKLYSKEKSTVHTDPRTKVDEEVKQTAQRLESEAQFSTQTILDIEVWDRFIQHLKIKMILETLKYHY